MVLASYRRRLNTDAKEQSNWLSIGKALKGKHVGTEIKPHAQQNDES
jgi:hypothetical protein